MSKRTIEIDIILKDEIYYQPDLSQQEWEASVLKSNDVYADIENAKADWPGKKINTFKNGDIEDRKYLD